MKIRGAAPIRILGACLLVAALAGQEQSESAPAQPIPYSHKTHLALGLKCNECHPNPNPGDKMTFVAASKCMACHATIAKARPTIQKLAESAKSKEPIPWVRVYSTAAGVYWSHRSHLEVGLKCDECHGQVAEMDVMAKVKEVTSMKGCIDCHRQHHAPIGCEFCHEGK
jgi:hypothetical protein